MLYVGEGDPIRPRLESHYAQKDFWNRAVSFVAAPGQLNKAHVQFLEAHLIRLAKVAKRMPLDNANQPNEPTLSEADRADMQVFLENMLGMLPVLGVHAFEQGFQASADRITLGQLRKLADGLDCELVYALVPRRPLTDVVQERARAIAMEEVAGVAHTMSLEEQRPGAEQLRKQVERRTDELLRGRWSNLWR